MHIWMTLGLSRAVADARQFPAGTLSSWVHPQGAHSIFTDVPEPSRAWGPSAGARLGIQGRLAPLVPPVLRGEEKEGQGACALMCVLPTELASNCSLRGRA